MSYVYNQKVRTAKKFHDCYDCGGMIFPGEKYLACTASPQYDFNDTGKWRTEGFCYNCSKDSKEWKLPVVTRPLRCVVCGAEIIVGQIVQGVWRGNLNNKYEQEFLGPVHTRNAGRDFLPCASKLDRQFNH